MDDYNSFSMTMIVTPSDWDTAVAYAQPKPHQDGEPYREQMVEAVVRVLRQIADGLETGEHWRRDDHPIFVNGHRVGWAGFDKDPLAALEVK